MDVITLKESLTKHEGYREFPYRDSEGNWTVATGHLIHNTEIPRGLQTLGQLMDWLTERQRHNEWLISDINDAINVAKGWLGPVLTTLNDARQRVVTELGFQLGYRLHGFEQMKAALIAHDYDRAADEGLRSLWAQQTPKRARELMSIMRTGA